MSPTDSATRFGEILPLWEKNKSPWQLLDGLFCPLQNFKATLANFCDLGQIFIVVKGQTLKNNLAIWSHCRPSEKALHFISSTLLEHTN